MAAHIGPYFGPLRAAQVTSEFIAKPVDLGQSEDAQNATVNREMAASKCMFRLGMYSTPPKVMRLPRFPKLTGDNVRKGFLEDVQYLKLIDANPETWFRTLVEMGGTYGWPVSELLKLRVEQIDLKSRTIRLDPGTTKDREGREVTMTHAIHYLLSECVAEKSATDHVFTRANGLPVLFSDSLLGCNSMNHWFSHYSRNGAN